MTATPNVIDPASLFLGPKAENADTMERLLLEAFRDHVFWRRNFHPEDGFLIREHEKRSAAYESAISTLSQELLGLLAELKAGVPFFSPRYVGHMTSDLTMASLIAYFATMLYNPNNVAAEGSPVTTRLELEVAEQLARMIGYDPARQWGHLCSGGTVANIEALWVARSVKYLPVALRWAARALGLDAPAVRLATGETESLASVDLWQLLNIPPDAALDALEMFASQAGDLPRAIGAVMRNSPSGLGYQEFGIRLHTEFGDALPPGVVLVPATAHYSFAKSARVLGLGDRQIVHVPVDRTFRVDTDALRERLDALAARRQPVIACVSVIGTTEESAIDRLDLITELRDDVARRLGLAFHLHADAAWGGYATTVTRGASGARRSFAEVTADHPELRWPSEEVYRALCALERTDWVTIDPHKLGFVPYPAGAISLRDRRARVLVAADAPYVFHDTRSDSTYIGRYILEGSKPGAAAAAVWMSHKVVPLDATGYGRLITDCARGALRLHSSVAEADWSQFVVALLPVPDLNIVCFAVGHPYLTTLEQVNELVERVYRAMSVDRADRAASPAYFVTKTVLGASEDGHAADAIVEALGFGHDDFARAGGLGVIRCTVMDPFLGGERGRTDYIRGFIDATKAVLETALTAVAPPP